jgi:hypothetical protein
MHVLAQTAAAVAADLATDQLVAVAASEIALAEAAAIVQALAVIAARAAHLADQNHSVEALEQVVVNLAAMAKDTSVKAPPLIAEFTKILKPAHLSRF